MGRIPIPRVQYGPPAKAGTAKSPWPGYMTGDRRAMAGFGHGMISLGDRLGSIVIDQLVQGEFVSGKAALQRKDNEFLENAVNDPEYEKLSEKYNNESKKWQEAELAKFKTPGARNALKNMIIADAPRMEVTLNGIITGKAQEDARRKLIDSIQGTEEESGFIPSAGATPEELELGIVNATAAMQGAVETGLYSIDEAEEIVIYSLMEDWPEVALKEIDASSLDPQRKLQLKSNAKTIIRNIKNKEKIAEQEVWDKTEAEAFNLNFDNELTPEWVREQFNLGNLNTSDRDAYLSLLSRPKVVKLNWNVFDNLLEMIKDYDKEKVTKEKVRLAITNALGKDIPEDIAKGLRTKLDVIDKPDDPLNRSDVKSGQELFDALKTLELESAETSEEIIEIHKKYLKKQNEYEKAVKEKENLTNKDVDDFINQAVKAKVKDATVGWLARIFRGDYGTGAAPFFGGGFPITKTKKEKAGIKEEPTEKKILTSEIAGQYLNLAGGDRKKAEQLAKDDGYSW